MSASPPQPPAEGEDGKRNRVRTPSVGSIKWFGLATRPEGAGTEMAQHSRTASGGTVNRAKSPSPNPGMHGRKTSNVPSVALSATASGTASRKVRTVPPYARDDPPSPPTSPRILAAAGTGGFSHMSRPSTHTLGPILTKEKSRDRSASPAAINLDADEVGSSSHGHTVEDDEDANQPPAWWTFNTRPWPHHSHGQGREGRVDGHGREREGRDREGRVRSRLNPKPAFQGLQAAWQGTMQANRELMEENEFWGRDYFSPKSERGMSANGSDTPGGALLWRFGPGDAGRHESLAAEGERGGSGSATPVGPSPSSAAGLGLAGLGAISRTGRFKAMSLPGSRRTSHEDHNRFARADRYPHALPHSPLDENEEHFTSRTSLDLPPRRPGNTTAPSTPPARPASIAGEIRNPPSPRATPSRRTQKGLFHITMPEPIFTGVDTESKTGLPPAAIFRAQAPPTPVGWDKPWRVGASSFRRGSMLAQSSHEAGAAPPSPWSRAANANHTWGSLDDDSPEDGAGLDISQSHESTAVGTTGSAREKRKAAAEAAGKSMWWPFHRKQGSAGSAFKKRSTMVNEPPKTRKQRLRQFLMFDARSAIYLKAVTIVCLAVSLGIAASVHHLDLDIGLGGIIGSSPILTMIYAPPTLLHSLIGLYREAFGRPIGLWGLRSKMIWVCLDLFFICIWASNLSLAIADYLTTPLQCTFASPWWAAYPSATVQLNPAAELAQDKICARQAGVISFVLFVTVCYVANMILSLFRILERLATLHKAYEMGGMATTGGVGMV